MSSQKNNSEIFEKIQIKDSDENLYITSNNNNINNYKNKMDNNNNIQNRMRNKIKLKNHYINILNKCNTHSNINFNLIEKT